MAYYVVKVYGLICDGAGCEASIECMPPIGARNKLTAARRELAREPDGWTYRAGPDLCAKCSKDNRPVQTLHNSHIHPGGH